MGSETAPLNLKLGIGIVYRSKVFNLFTAHNLPHSAAIEKKPDKRTQCGSYYHTDIWENGNCTHFEEKN